VTSDPAPGSGGAQPGNGLPAGEGQPAGGAHSPGAYPPAYGPPASYGPPSYGPGPYGPPLPYGPPQVPGPYGPSVPPGAAGPQVPAGFVQPGMRAASADRDRTIDVLTAAYGEGRLSKDEFEARCSRVLGARTYAELATIVADLPAGPLSGVMPYQSGYYPAAMPPTSGLAIASLVCGIAELFTLGIAAIPAVILGHAARSHIKRTGERGDGMAIAGLVLGYLCIAGWALVLIAIVASRNSGNAP
jgi:Domain of unknown function (DUF4190)/Domain of unknown function (DUF1707)